MPEPEDRIGAPTHFWTPARIAAVTAGAWLRAPHSGRPALSGLGIDGRRLAPGQVFVAIVGERCDGHDFAEQAVAAGAGLLIVERRIDPLPAAPVPVLQVASTVAALQALASAYRAVLRASGCRVVSVSGSNGKTTTRYLVHHVLTQAGLRGSQSPRSFNNHLGVPLTLLAARPDDDFVACELGTNHPGEIAMLARLARPDIAVITSIGEEHLAAFGDLDGVAREEAAVLDWVAHGGTAVLPAAQSLPVQLPVLPNPQFWLVRVALDPLAEHTVLPGLHDHWNASAAAVVARLFGIADGMIGAALRTARPASMRGEVLFADDPARPTLINDAYNANPSSMRAALAMLCAWPARAVNAVSSSAAGSPPRCPGTARKPRPLRARERSPPRSWPTGTRNGSSGSSTHWAPMRSC